MFWNFILREASICKTSQNRCNLIYSIFKCLLLFTRYSFVLPYIFYLVEDVKLLQIFSFVLHSFTHILQFLFNKSARQTIKVMSIALPNNFCQTINIFPVINVVFISCYTPWSHILFHRHCVYLINLHIMCDSVCMIEK